MNNELTLTIVGILAGAVAAMWGAFLREQRRLETTLIENQKKLEVRCGTLEVKSNKCEEDRSALRSNLTTAEERLDAVVRKVRRFSLCPISACPNRDEDEDDPPTHYPKAA